jgi:hypothetical protein
VTSENARACQTCHGEGSVGSELGAARCPDCGGTGTLPGRDVLVEWRVTQIERVHGGKSDEVSGHIRWLAFELRKARQALNQVIALSAELDEEHAIAQRIRFVANDALGLYQPVEGEKSAK